MVTGDGRVPLLHLVFTVLTRRLGCTAAAWHIEDDPVDVHLSIPNGASELACDGAIRPGQSEIYGGKLPGSLTVYQPRHANRFPR